MRFVAGRGAVAERHREDVAGRGAEAEMLAGAPWRSDCREAEPWQGCWLGRCCKVAGWGAAAELLAGAPWQRCCCQGDPSGRGEKSMREGKAASEKNMHLFFHMNKI
ncbi:MAG: hypothetical protein ACI3YW_02360 [Candidatus Egerieousia sp.]